MKNANAWKSVLAALAFVSASGCTYNKVYVTPAPLTATMEMEVINSDGTRQWKKVQRMVYEYPLPPKPAKD